MKNNFLNLVSVFILSIVLSGCIHRELFAPTKPVVIQPDNNVEQNIDTKPVEIKSEDKSNVIVPRIAFPVQEYSKLAKDGTATVHGIIYLTTRDGKRVYGGKTRLYLNPVTSYSRQWFSESYISGYKMEKADKRLNNYIRFTKSDSNSRFSFYNVPKGSYFAIGAIKCGTECGYDTPKVIRIAKEIFISGSEEVRIALNKRIF